MPLYKLAYQGVDQVGRLVLRAVADLGQLSVVTNVAISGKLASPLHLFPGVLSTCSRLQPGVEGGVVLGMR